MIRIEYDYGQILIDGIPVSNAELMDIILELQKQLIETEKEIKRLKDYGMCFPV